MDNYGNLWIIMHVAETIIVTFVRVIVREGNAKFQPDPLTVF